LRLSRVEVFASTCDAPDKNWSVQNGQFLIFVMNTAMNVIKYNENDKRRIEERIRENTTEEGDCLIWNKICKATQIYFDNGTVRTFSPAKFILGKETNTIDTSQKKVRRTCENKKCLKREHLTLDPPCPLKKIYSLTTVNDNGCFIHKNGKYSRISFNGDRFFTHRAVYSLVKNDGNPIPKYNEKGEDLVIRHICNDPRCVNPDHLELGTHSENNYDDKKENGTLSQGEKNHSSKISEKLATQIKHSIRPEGHSEYMSPHERAIKYNVPIWTIRSIDNNTTWVHIPDRFGHIHDNSEKRKKEREYKKRKLNQVWYEKDFIGVFEILKNYIIESNNLKSGYFPEGKCWIWQRGKSKSGYGRFVYKGHPVHAHILSCEAKYKRKRREEEIVRHLCANRICCNPDHLIFGTRQENAIDCLYTKNNITTLDPSDVVNIYKSSKNPKELSILHNVHVSAIYNILSGRTWTHVTKDINK